MKSFVVLLNSLLLSLLLFAGTALASDQVDINTADAAQLEKSLVGIGPSKAEAIVQYRKENGPFKSADELALVKGIGLKTVERNRDAIVVGASRAPATSKPAATAVGAGAPATPRPAASGAPAKPPVARR